MSKHLYILSIILFSACHHKEMAKTTDAVKTTNVANPVSATKEVTIDPSADMAATGAMYQNTGFEIKGDTLVLTVQYSGGCKEHNWELVSNGMYAKSLPPQISVCLKHTNNGDACRELKIQELKFNISKLKNPSGKTVVVKMGENSARYSYN
jgi:hypothetical protein